MLERKRKEREVERQMVKKPRRGVGVDDGSSQKTSSSVDSSVTMDGAYDGGVDDGSSLAMDAMDDEEETQPEEAAGATVEVESAVLPSEDEF